MTGRPQGSPGFFMGELLLEGGHDGPLQRAGMSRR